MCWKCENVQWRTQTRGGGAVLFCQVADRKWCSTDEAFGVWGQERWALNSLAVRWLNESRYWSHPDPRPPSRRLQHDKSGVYLLKQKTGRGNGEQGKSQENQYGSYGGVALDWSFSPGIWVGSVFSAHNLFIQELIFNTFKKISQRNHPEGLNKRLIYLSKISV